MQILGDECQEAFQHGVAIQFDVFLRSVKFHVKVQLKIDKTILLSIPRFFVITYLRCILEHAHLIDE